ncbi:hypothetical protein [uncultured Bradyrhizobium sp.]|jgi:hypothetical protein|uniref:hypothetical protein n=1 Tax=uncultured Bradyrhizobium sp. TaxID=199684 RepID=UPI0026106BB4|nr:hypothetical protein [uncultured Bradyrhizobium sp.]
MQLPSLTADVLALLALICAVVAVQMIRLRRSGQIIFNGGILLGLGLAIACSVPVLSHLPWAELAEEASDQAIAAAQLLYAAYVILTL